MPHVIVIIIVTSNTYVDENDNKKKGHLKLFIV